MKVKVYSTPLCPYCRRLKEFLRENGIEFEDVNVAEDRDALMEMIRKSGQMAVPVTDINGRIIVGFDTKALKKALGFK
ncbi:TPA: NrdH-redoxin [Candidatus Bathyarchaeota archaeon]|nr:NrdH-redoxin [Candidatus Bathyarchaeota archaeon]